jgi:hypothetical protein
VENFSRTSLATRVRALLSLIAISGFALASTVGCSSGGESPNTPQAGIGGTAPSSGGTIGAGAGGAGATSGGASGAGTTGGSGALGGSGGTGGSGGASAGQSATGGVGGTGGASGAGVSGGGSAGQGGSSGTSAGSSGQGGSAGAAAGGAGGNAGVAAGGAGGAAGAAAGSGGNGMSGGGGAPSAGCGKQRTLQDGNRSVQSGGTQRTYVLRVPTDYDNNHPYRLMLGFHGANGKGSDVAPSYFGLWSLSQGSTIFAAPDAVSGLWSASADTAMVTALVDQLSNDLCIDTSRIAIEGFSQGGAMVWTLACALPGKFRLAIVHSGGGLPMPQSCEPIPFFSALGTDGSGQGMSSDFFARTNGCTVETLPSAPTGGHACTNYQGCDAGFPTRWCDYDAGHTPAAVDAGQSMSWVPQEVWTFVQQF